MNDLRTMIHHSLLGIKFLSYIYKYVLLEVLYIDACMLASKNIHSEVYLQIVYNIKTANEKCSKMIKIVKLIHTDKYIV